MTPKVSSRFAQEKIRELNKDLVSNPFLQAILEYAPMFVGVLTDTRQFVAVNDSFFSHMGMNATEMLLGMRPGEVFNCIHHCDSPLGCGEGSACKFCGAIKVMVKALKENSAQVGEARIFTGTPESPNSLNFRVEAKPIAIADQRFVLLYIYDIIAEKEKELLERIFFHDLLNSAGNVFSLVDLAFDPSSDPMEAEHLGPLIQTGIADVVEQIDYYRNLRNAESGEYRVSTEEIDLDGEIRNLVGILRLRHDLDTSGIILKYLGSSLMVKSNRTIVRRVILNLLKNAVEASKAGDHIEVELLPNEDHGIITVKNSAVMAPSVKSQVFQRSFSTKGPGRGFGTYSVKMLTARSLGGKVTFTSEPGEGTVFTVSIPKQR